MKKYQLYIDGSWQDSSDGKTFKSYNKANGQEVAEFATATEKDVDKACQAARSAFKRGVWSGLDADTRAGYMLKAAEIMRRRLEELAEYEAMETGKPYHEASTFDIPVSIWALEHFANLARNVKGDVLPVGDVNFRAFDFVTYEPYGVAAIIAPYNFPLHLLTRSLAPALAAGNTCVMKAADKTPSTTAIIDEIFEEAGFPAGSVNILHGPGRLVGQAMVAHREVDIVGFTGSEEIGRQLMRTSADSPVIKKLVLELGGKGPAIVLPDADLEIATDCQVEGFTFNTGQVCCAITRLILHDSIYDEYIRMLSAKLDRLKIGDPLERETRLGCLISEEHLQKVDGFVREAVAAGAKVLYGGERYTEGTCKDGPFYKPTILGDVTNNMDVCRKEVFGPVLSVLRYSDLEDAIEMANDTDFGLGANIYTEDLKLAYQISPRLNAGSVWVNLPNGMHIGCPFGGNKNSGMGREYGTYGLGEYMKVKNNMWRMHGQGPAQKLV